MTTYETLSIIGQALSLCCSSIGFLTVIISIGILIAQTRELSAQTKYVGKSLKAGIFIGAEDRLTALDEIFVTYPEIRPYFYESKAIEPDDPNYQRVCAAAEFLLDYFDAILIQVKQFPETWPQGWWESFIEDTFAESPVLCNHLYRIADSGYTKELLEAMHRGEASRKNKVSQNQEETV